MIPNVFFLYWTGSEFSVHQYISIKSIHEIEKPDEIFLYYNDPIPQDNIWWERTLKLVTLKELNVDEFPEFEDILSITTDPKSRSDVFSALVLCKYGGIYSDFDTITIKSIRDQIDDCSAFLASCRSVTSVYDPNNEMFVSLGDKSDFDVWSYVANGNMGSKVGHPYFRAVLEMFRDDIDDPGLYKYITAYELNREKFPDIKIVPWAVFHTIRERKRHIRNPIDEGGISFRIEDFFQHYPYDPNPDTRVFHYYSSKADCAHLLTKMPTAFMIRYSNSMYSKYATPYIKEFIPDWKKDGYIIHPDRYILEQKIIPHLTGKVCFVGVAPYVKHYWSEIFPDSVQITTLDRNERVAQYGAPNHFVISAQFMHEDTDSPFDYVIIHGIAGYGTYTKTDLRTIFSSVYASLKPGGIFIYGWSNHKNLRVAHPEYCLKNQDGFETVSFRDLPKECKANDYIDPKTEYNVPLDEIKMGDSRFMFFKRPEEN